MPNEQAARLAREIRLIAEEFLGVETGSDDRDLELERLFLNTLTPLVEKGRYDKAMEKRHNIALEQAADLGVENTILKEERDALREVVEVAVQFSAWAKKHERIPWDQLDAALDKLKEATDAQTGN